MNLLTSIILSVILFSSSSYSSFSQVKPEKGDPANPVDIPEFFKSRLSDIDIEISNVRLGDVGILGAYFNDALR